MAIIGVSTLMSFNSYATEAVLATGTTQVVDTATGTTQVVDTATGTTQVVDTATGTTQVVDTATDTAQVTETIQSEMTQAITSELVQAVVSELAQAVGLELAQSVETSLATVVEEVATEAEVASEAEVSPWTDVAMSHWAYEGATYMKELGYMAGTSTGEFLVNQTINYFELCEILALVAGYENSNINPLISPELRLEIETYNHMYEPLLNEKQNAYISWSTIANEEIAYLLGKGILLEEEIDNFFERNAAGNLVRASVKKEDLAVMLVRIIGDEETAIEDYTTGAFSDEWIMEAYKRPHVAYLKSIGLVGGSSEGMFGAGSEVTRGILAKMSADAIKFAEQSSIAVVWNESDFTNSYSADTTYNKAFTATIGKILPKNETEIYLVTKLADDVVSFYTLNKNLHIVAPDGSVTNFDALNINDVASLTVDKIGSNDYITSMTIISTGDGNSAVEGNADAVIGGSTGTGNAEEGYSLSYNAVIQSVSENGDRIEILVEDDILTGAKMIIRQVDIPSSTSVIIDGRSSYRSNLSAGMEVQLTYNSLIGTSLYKIQVIE